jgi:hypothetical protein
MSWVIRKCSASIEGCSLSSCPFSFLNSRSVGGENEIHKSHNAIIGTEDCVGFLAMTSTSTFKVYGCDTKFASRVESWAVHG